MTPGNPPSGIESGIGFCALHALTRKSLRDDIRRLPNTQFCMLGVLAAGREIYMLHMLHVRMLPVSCWKPCTQVAFKNGLATQQIQIAEKWDSQTKKSAQIPCLRFKIIDFFVFLDFQEILKMLDFKQRTVAEVGRNFDQTSTQFWQTS